MKIISKTFKMMSIFVLALSLTACGDDDDTTPVLPTTSTIVDLAVATGDLSTLVTALTLADGDLVNVLSGDGPFTVLAPTNAAFDAFLAANDFATIQDVPTDVLSQVLLNHVIAGEITSTTLTGLGSGYTNTSATGPGDNALSLYFDTTNGVRFNNVSSVVSGLADVEADNGIVHVVDAVIGLPTIATFATSNPALSTLVAGLQFADGGTPTVQPSYIDVVSDATAGPFTVFAPVNDAFTNAETGVLAELGLSGFGEADGELNAATTDAVLLMHIVSGNIQSSGLPNGTVSTLGGDITADNTAFTLTDGLNREIGIVTTLVNIQGINGVVHVVNRVIRPGSAD